MVGVVVTKGRNGRDGRGGRGHGVVHVVERSWWL